MGMAAILGIRVVVDMNNDDLKNVLELISELLDLSLSIWTLVFCLGQLLSL